MPNVTEEWYDSLRGWRMELFLIPASVLTALTLVADPLLLACILCSRALRQETRYLLLSNVLVADVLFVAVNLAILVCNAHGVRMLRPFCDLVTAASVTAYCGGVLTLTLMVADTYAAVRWPLQYRARLPPARTRQALVLVWLVAAVYPVSLVIAMEVLDDSAPWRPAVCLVLLSLGSIGREAEAGVHVYYAVGAVLCSALILYCYARLYAVTRTSGIWRSRYSRARLTLLAHAVALLLYFGPGLVFTLELHLFSEGSASQDVRVWINAVNMNVLMPLPRACAPFLYGLRYRDIHDTLLLLLRRRRLGQVTVA
ncbi:probable G-protein coupled receptor 148 [Megalops cyprinoides]|uniref:probable G-protein coupled receptor 148 n=1 Tax=Megalops cyprinoides TaxID=118141 RepID=UPI001864576B|nr:probable G-protein coupled receptor 148 [Megalops cyprinoides]